jgi:hypothetical protein
VILFLPRWLQWRLLQDGGARTRGELGRHRGGTVLKIAVL